MFSRRCWPTLPLAILVVCASLGTFPSSSSAQIVDVLKDAHVEEDGWSGQFSFPLEWFTGNTDLLRFGGRASVAWRKDRSQLILLVEGDYGRTGGEQVIGRIFEHLRYRYRVWGRVEAETFVQHSYHPFRRLAVRIVAGAGPRFELVGGESGSLWLGTAYMSEWERYSDDDAADANREFHTPRWSSYLQAELRFGESLRLGNTTYVQPAFTDFSDVRFSSSTNMRYNIVDPFFVEPSFSVVYDARAPDEVESLDTELRLSLGFQF